MKHRTHYDLTKEVLTVEILREKETGAVYTERWSNKDGECHRPIKDGPAMVTRDVYTGKILEAYHCLNNRQVDPKTGEPITYGIQLEPPRGRLRQAKTQTIEHG